MSLLNISTILGLDKSNERYSNNILRDITAEPIRVIGNFPITGSISFETSALLFPQPDGLSYNMHAERILIVDNKNNDTRVLNNVTFNNLKLVGINDVKITSNGTISLPKKFSENEYISVTLPPKFNIILKQQTNQSSLIKFVAVNGSSYQNYELKNVSVTFYNAADGTSPKRVLVLLKSPEVKANGHIGLKTANFDRYFRNYGIPLDLRGELKAKFDFVDDFEQSFSNGTTKMQYITYLKSISLNSTKHDGIKLQIPGDISPYAKNLGPQVPIIEALLSNNNLILLSVIATLGLFLSWFYGKKQKTQKNNHMAK